MELSEILNHSFFKLNEVFSLHGSFNKVPSFSLIPLLLFPSVAYLVTLLFPGRYESSSAISARMLFLARSSYLVRNGSVEKMLGICRNDRRTFERRFL